VTDEIAVHRHGASVAVLELVGEHYEYSARKIGVAIAALVAERRHVVVDLRRTTFLDSVTVSQLLVANITTGARGLGFAVVVAPSSGWPVRTMFEVAHLGDFIAVETTLERAIESVFRERTERRVSGERRRGLDRRQLTNVAPRIERRSGRDRRSGSDRRSRAGGKT
jgi:anti-anti-sigma regulatory factor